MTGDFGQWHVFGSDSLVVARSITGRSGGCELTMEIISLSCDLVVRKKQFVNKLWINL
jgi:hypothetical protein